jgi:hypothetical protein
MTDMAENITHVVVDGEGGILRTAHLSVLVALAKAIRAWGIAELCSLCEELGGVLIVDKDDIVDAPLMEERKLVEGMWELRSSMLGGALEPLDAFLWPLGHAQFAVELCDSEAVQGPWVRRSSSFAVELDCLCGLATAAPAILAAGTGSVGGIGVAMLSCEDEEREGTIKVLAVLVCADAVSKAVGKEVLGGHVSTVGVAFEEGGSLLYEIFALFDSFFDVYDVGRREGGNGEGFGCVDHKDGKLELEIGVLSFLGVGTVKLKGALVGEEGRLLSRPQVRMVEDRPRGW